jgi:hypothetical protein
MSIERRDDLYVQVCETLDIPYSEDSIKAGVWNIGGFDASIDYYDDDPAAIYLSFDYGIVTAGRTLRIFRLLLEANLTIYAQDQAQLGLDSELGTIVLLVRLTLSDDMDGGYLTELLEHYVDHGMYWRDNILQASDEMFDNLARGTYQWIKA